MCSAITEILMNHNYFLRIFELRNKFREVRLKTVTEKKVLRELSSCIKANLTVLKLFQYNVVES